VVEATVREAIGQLEHNTDITVQLHPEDLALLKKNDAAILNGAPGADSMKFHPATEVSRGGCIIQTRFGMIDARRETKIEQLRKSLA
jgi:flagellar biosynthesis/type III secretory pathway protein FliH